MDNQEVNTQNRDQRLPFKTVTLTFYDSLETIPFTTTFYVRADATLGQIQELVRCIESLSECVLAKYKIESQPMRISDDASALKTETETFEMSDYRERVAQSTAIAGRKWRVTYKDSKNTTKSHTIPGRNPETSYRYTMNMHGKDGYKPDLRHPKWKSFLEIFQTICLSNKGREIRGEIKADYSDVKWSPKSPK